jgi:hypothetical protein
MPEFKDLNTTTKRIYVMMTNASWAVYQGVTNGNWTFQAISSGGPPGVMLVPAKLSEEPLYEHVFSTPLSCPRDKHVVFVPGINASAVLLAAFYYHEFGHLLQSTNMDRNLAEVEMHTLSIDICVHGKPEYNKKIQEIIHRGGLKSFKYALASVTEKDLEEMDDILLARSTTNKKLSIYMAVQHLLAVGFAYEDRYGSADPAHKAEIYKFVISL